MRARAAILVALLTACSLAAPGPLLAYESDQYSNRTAPIADSRAALNRLVNAALEEVVSGWHGLPNKLRFARAVYWRVGGLHWVDHIERWAMRSPEVERLPRPGRRGVFAGSSFFFARVNAVFGVAQTIQVDGVLVGTDKLGHFFSQGVKYFESHFRGESEAEVLDRGRVNERLIFGQLTTGVYSNADLVANYEGYLFYRGLFEDGVVAGRPALVAWQAGKPRLARSFDWADHVNDYWDEALNPSHFGRGLQRFMSRRLVLLCGEYTQHPDLFRPRREADLESRYASIGLRPAPENRVDVVCDKAGTPAAAR